MNNPINLAPLPEVFKEMRVKEFKERTMKFPFENAVLLQFGNSMEYLKVAAASVLSIAIDVRTIADALRAQAQQEKPNVGG